MIGSLSVVGVGPGDPNLITPEVSLAMVEASDLIGYGPYLNRMHIHKNKTLHASDNRKELERAELGLELAQSGKKVVIVSSGDPGVFAMAAAVMEAIDNGKQEWKKVKVSVLPGITAMLAASAKLGAPLGHDFCGINLSDNLKPWEVIEKRVTHALQADFVISLYNPRSVARPNHLGKILKIVKNFSDNQRIIIFAKAISTEKEKILVNFIDDVDPNFADMSTLVIIGSSQTKAIPDTSFVYSPRSVL